METIIHIGQHKTGTTSLQHFLHENKLELRKQNIFITDTILAYSNHSHYILNVYSLAKNRFSSMKENILNKKGQSYLDELDKTLRIEMGRIYKLAIEENCSKIIWSNEGLYLLNSADEYKKLRNLFVQYSSKITVVCCFRDKKTYQTSYTKQLEKQNITTSTNFDSYRNTKEDSWLFDYRRKKTILNEVFDRCIYFDYDSKNNIKPFLNLLGITLEIPSDLRLNSTAKQLSL